MCYSHLDNSSQDMGKASNMSRDMFLSLRSCLGDSYPVNREVINDVSKIMEKD